MKTIKKSFLMITLIAVFVCIFSVIANADTYGDLTYTVSDGKVTITGCSTSATSVNIPSTIDGYPVTIIGDLAFRNCKSLKSITIPEGVTNIGTMAFINCTGLEQINWNAKSINECSGSVWDGAGQASNGINVVFGASVEIIPGNAFASCNNLKSVTIPDNVTSIGSYSFENCVGLETVTIGDGVTSIGGYSFRGCTSLTNVSIGDSVTEIGLFAFKDCISLTDITIPDSVTSIGSFAFGNCRSLTSITIPEGVTSIDTYAFDSCVGLTQIFWNAKSVDDIASNGILSDAGQVDTGITVVLGANVEKIPSYAFAYCDSITSITIPDSVISIGSAAFYKCSGLTSIIIPDSVTKIRDSAFAACTGLTNVTIGDGVTSIGFRAFSNCRSLASVTIPGRVTSIDREAFNGCTGLKEVHISDIASWCGIDFYDHDSNPLYYAGKLYVNNELITNLIIPDGVTSIGSYAFSSYTDITSVTIPDSVTSIGDSAFAACTGLNEVHINDIASWCSIVFGNSYSNPLFYAGKLYVNNELITNLIIPDGVTSIGADAFYNCTCLTSVTIPAGVKSIGDSAFASCTGLTSVIISDGVINIEDFAFEYCTALTSITIPDSVTRIGDSAFASCTGLTNVIISDGVTIIGFYAFEDCLSLTSVTIGENVTRIDGHAFYGCKNLTQLYWNAKNVDDFDWNNYIFAYAGQDGEGMDVVFGDSVEKIPAYAFCPHYSSSYAPKIVSVTIGKNVTSIGEEAFGYFEDLIIVKYDANGGENLPNLQVKLYDKSIKLSSVKPTRIGYKFLGWSTDKDATEPEYKSGATYKDNVYVTLYAVWEEVIIPVNKVTLNTSKLSVIVGGEATLTATVSPVDANYQYVTWSSYNESIATVDENGVVTAHKAGKVKVTAMAGSGKKATCSITVGEPATKVEFTSLKSTSLAVGKTLTLKAKASRDDKVKPVSTNVVYEIIEGEEYATIDDKGKLKGIATGEVVVRATAEAGTEDAHAEVVINVCIPATKVKLNKTKASMIVGGEDLYLSAEISPENNTDTLTWSVDKPEIAEVDENGVVTALKAGKVKVTAVSGSGKKATCSITVGEPATKVEFSSLKSTSLAVGKTLTLKAKASRDDKVKPVSTAVVFEIVEGEEFATIDAKGKLKGIATGEVVVRATAEAGTEDAHAEVIINVCIPATKVKLNMTKATVSLSDGELQLEANITPLENTDTLTWMSANEDIASVDDNGLVTVRSKGKVKITAMTGSGKKATCTVTVTE